MMNPIVQASRTQAPETDPAMIGVLALCLDHNGREGTPTASACSDDAMETREKNGLDTPTH